MGYQKPNYTQTPNTLFDLQIKEMGEAELKVTLAVIRKTFGWHKEKDKISLSQLIEITGLSRQGVINGVTTAISRGVIQRELVSNTKQGGYYYSLVVNEVDHKVVNAVDTQKKVSKETILASDKSDEEFWDAKSAEAKARPKMERKSKAELERLALGISNDPYLGVINEFRADLQDYAYAWAKVSGQTKLTKTERGDWSRTFNEWIAQGVKLSDIKLMYQYARDREWGIARPGSITKAYRMMQTGTAPTVEDKLASQRRADEQAHRVSRG